MANESKSTSITGLITDITAETIFKLNAHAGVLDAINWKDLEPTGGTTASWPIYAAISSSDVQTGVTEGSSVTTNKEVTNTAVTATVARNVIATLATDQAQFGAQSTNSDFVSDVSTMFSDALLAAIEAEIVALYSGFSTTVSGIGPGSALTLDNIFSAKAALRSAGANVRDLVMVLSPQQYEGPNGLRNAISDTGSGVAGTNVLSEQFLQQGFVDVVAGVPVLVSNEITETTSATGAIYEKTRALGFASNGLVNVEEQRQARAGAWDIVASGYWKAKELNDTYGVKLVSLI